MGTKTELAREFATLGLGSLSNTLIVTSSYDERPDAKF